VEQLFGVVNIAEIIKTASGAGVKSLRITKSSLEVDSCTQNEYKPLEEPVNPPLEVPSVSQNLTPEQEKALKEVQDAFELEQIKLMDPLQYEELLADGKIEDVQDEQDDYGLKQSL